MDNLELASLLAGKQKEEDVAQEQSASGATIIYMIAVSDSANGEVILKPEDPDPVEWDALSFTEIDEDGDYIENEIDESYEDGPDGIVDDTEGGADITDNEVENELYNIGGARFEIDEDENVIMTSIYGYPNRFMIDDDDEMIVNKSDELPFDYELTYEEHVEAIKDE